MQKLILITNKFYIKLNNIKQVLISNNVFLGNKLVMFESIKPKKRTVKDEIIDVEVDSDNK